MLRMLFKFCIILAMVGSVFIGCFDNNIRGQIETASDKLKEQAGTQSSDVADDEDKLLVFVSKLQLDGNLSDLVVGECGPGKTEDNLSCLCQREADENGLTSTVCRPFKAWISTEQSHAICNIANEGDAGGLDPAGCLISQDVFGYDGYFLPTADGDTEPLQVFSFHEEISLGEGPSMDINRQADGTTFSGLVWTGTDDTGSFFGADVHSCTNWTDATFGQTGLVGSVNDTSNWTYADDNGNSLGISDCDNEHNVYCFEVPTR